MKYKLLRFSLLSMLVMLFGGAVFAALLEGSETPEPEVTLDFTDKSKWDIPTDGSSNKDLKSFTNGTHTIKLYATTNYKANNGYLILGKANSYLELPAFSFDVEKIVVEGASSASGDVLQNVFTVVEDQDVIVSTATKGAKDTNTYLIDKDYQAAGTIYKLKVTSNHNTQISKIHIYKKVDENDTRVATTVELEEGYATTGKMGDVLDLPAVTVKDASGAEISGAQITWSSSNEDVATISEGKIKLLLAGNTVIKASYEGDETNYKGSKATYSLEVSAAITDGYFNFNLGLDYGSNVTHGSVDISTSTWTAGNVVMNVSGRNCWYTDNTLRIYKKDNSGDNNAGTLKFSVPNGKAINKIVFTGNGALNSISADSEKYDTSTFTWEGSANTVTFTVNDGASTVQIETITVSYADDEATSTWRDIKLDLTNGNLLEESEKVQWGAISPFGIAVAEDGAVSRVAADATNSRATVQGKWHSNQCWASLNMTVNVEGPVKVTCGTQPWSDSQVTIKNGDETVATFSNKGTLWTSSETKNVVSGYYRGPDAATLTIDGGGYPTYIAIEAIDPADLPAEVTEFTITFDKGSEAEGIVPKQLTVEEGTAAIIPANRTLWVEGKTLTAWTDGTTQYAPGSEITPTADMTLTPVFTENTTSFDKRTTEVTALWDFTQKTGGAPLIAIEGANNSSAFVVTQIDVNGSTIDFRFDVDATSGKFNNSNGEWCQISNGTKFTLPAYKGAQYTIYSMVDSGDATFNGETGAYANNNTSYTYNGDSETMEIVIGTGTWFKTLTAVYPVPAEEPKPLYITGNFQGEWSTSAPIEMTFNEESSNYEYELIVNQAPMYFTIATGKADSWDEFGQYRMGIAAGNQDVTTGTEYQLANYADGTLVLNETGTFVVSVTSDLKMTITRKADTYVVAGAFVDANNESTAGMFVKAWSTDQESNVMWLDEETGLYTKEYSVTFDEPVTIEYKIVKNSNVWYGDPNNNDPEDTNKNYKYAITETGTYDITVTFDTKNELATMTATKQNSGDEPTESVLYSWDTGTEDGGKAVASDGESVGYANASYTTIRLNGKNDFSTNTVNISLDKALSAGDKIAITAYRNKNAADKQTGALLKFEKGEKTVSTATSEKAGLEFVNIDTSDDSAADQNRGTEPNTVTLEVPADAAGSKTITMTRAIQGTNLFITKLVITTTSEGGDEPEDPTGFTFRDFNTELNTLLNDTDGETVTFGLSVAEDGAVSRVAADTKNTAAVVTGKTGNDHGLQNFSATVPVEGAVKITMGTCSWGGEVTVKNADDETVATFTTKKGEGGAGCYKGNKFDDENIVSAKYVGDATTLTISGGAYVNFFAVEAIEASSVDVAYSLGEVECEGDILPTGGTFAAGDEYTIPANNFTLYKEGYTLTGWTDGQNTYAAGEKITLSESITLTPVFTQNEVSLADRTEPVTLKWNFRRDQGAPVLNYQNKAGILVAQASIGDKTIDVAMPFTTSDGGKLNNTNNTDCAQCNNNTTFTIPSCKNAVVTMESYGGNYIFKADGKTATTVDGQSDYEAGQTLNYTIANSAETINIVMGNDAGYVRFVQVVLPVVESQGGGETFDNVDVLVEWPFDKHPAAGEDYSVTKTPDGAISIASFEILGDLSKSEKVSNPLGTGARSVDPDNGLAFITFCGESNMQLHWFVKPTKGLTLTPTQIKMYVQRFGTNKEDGVVVTAKKEGGEVTTLGTYTARRANWTTEQEKNQFNWTEVPSTLVNEVVIDLTTEQQAALASGEGFHLYAVTGLGNEKFGGFADIRIAGKVDGTAASVEMFTLAAAASPEEGGTVSKYPNADEYEAGSEVTMTATENFGYDFVNWTNAAGEEVSTDAKFKYTVNSNETLTANFVAVETYELALDVDGTNDYMVTVSPAPEVVDGKWMYEAGTAVQLTANQYEGLVTFTNWNDGETNSSKLISMDADTELTAYYAQADIIAGWDFYKAGNNGRKADFYAQDNDADALNLVNTETGETSGWLDKSTVADGGYESFKGAAVNWRDNVGTHHWQTKVNAEAFENINVQFQMLYNYNSYQKYNAEYSFDGETWVNFGSITMEGAKNAASFSEKLPEACNNKAELYIRMIADKNSEIVGAAGKDGNALAMFFITGTPKIVDDGVAPVLISTVPADGATGVSASGKIVLTFDERVKVAEGTMAYINNPEMKSIEQNPTTPTVSGKVITFEYKGLEYGTQYNFVLAGKTVGDLTDNMIQDAIQFSFTTMERPTVDKKLYDAVVENVDQLMAAISEAQNRADKNVRYRIFLKKGTYTLPQGTADKTFDVELANGSTTSFTKKDPITYFNAQNVSMIGEDRDATIITNTIPADDTFEGKYGTASIYEGIGKSDVFQLSGSNSYWQDLTVSTGMADARGRDIAVEDKGTRTIWKNTKLHGYQDTWVGQNDNGLYYFEDGVIRGRTDYICGKGDAYYNQVEFQQIAGGYCAVPSKPANIGWVMKDCTINGDGSGVDGNYTLGRPWGQGTPVALWIDTKMNVVPSAIGWNEMSGGWPARFAEYNSMTSTGSQVDLSGRKKTFGDGHANNPVLTAAEALNYSDKSKMFGEWQPTLATEQAPIVTDVKLTDNELSWTGSNYALLYAIVKNGEVIDFTTETTYNISTAGSRRSGSTDQYQIRAANEMGGLNEASEVATETDGIETVNDNVNVNLNDNIYNLQGIRVNKAQKGVYIIGGRKVVIK